MLTVTQGLIEWRARAEARAFYTALADLSVTHAALTRLYMPSTEQFGSGVLFLQFLRPISRKWLIAFASGKLYSLLTTLNFDCVQEMYATNVKNYLKFLILLQKN